MAPLDPRDRLIVALDLPDVDTRASDRGRARRCVNFYKIGLELAYAGGLVLAEQLARTARRSFST